MLTSGEAGWGAYGNNYSCNFSISLKLAETKKRKLWHDPSPNFSVSSLSHFLFSKKPSQAREPIWSWIETGLRIGSKLGVQSLFLGKWEWWLATMLPWGHFVMCWISQTFLKLCWSEIFLKFLWDQVGRKLVQDTAFKEKQKSKPDLHRLMGPKLSIITLAFSEDIASLLVAKTKMGLKIGVHPGRGDQTQRVLWKHM